MVDNKNKVKKIAAKDTEPFPAYHENDYNQATPSAPAGSSKVPPPTPASLRRSARLANKVRVVESPGLTLAVTPKRNLRSRLATMNELEDVLGNLELGEGAKGMGKAEDKGKGKAQEADQEKDKPVKPASRKNSIIGTKPKGGKSSFLNIDDPKVDLMASAWPDFGAPSAPIMPAPMTRSHVKTRSYVEDDDSVDEAPAPLADLPPVTIPKSLQKNTQPAAKTGKVSIKFKPMVQSPPIAPITGHVTRAQSNATAAAVTAPPPPPPGDPNLDDMQFRMCKFLLHIQELMGWSAEKTLLDVTQADADMLHAQLKAAKEESEESEVLVKMLDLIEKFQELRALHAEYLEMVDEYGLGVEKKEVEDGEN